MSEEPRWEGRMVEVDEVELFVLRKIARKSLEVQALHQDWNACHGKRGAPAVRRSVNRELAEIYTELNSALDDLVLLGAAPAKPEAYRAPARETDPSPVATPLQNTRKDRGNSGETAK